MKQQDWTEQLRERLADHEMPAPEGLWADIEQRLPARRARLVVLRRWVIGAAACGLILFGTWQLTRVRPSAQAPVATSQTMTAGSDRQTPDNGKVSPTTPAPVTSSADDRGLLAAVPVLPRSEAEGQDNTPSLPIKDEVDRQPEPESPQLPADHQQPHPSDSPSHSVAPQPPSSPQQVAVTPSRSLSTLQLHADNMIAQNNSTQVEPFLMASPNQMAGARQTPDYLDGYEEQWEHSMPFTIGFSARLPISQRWWMETGINYTTTTSTFTQRLRSIVTVDEQRLNYLGVPLNVGYDVWANRWLSVYVSAGAEADACLQNKMKSNGQQLAKERDRMQFSLQSHAGLDLQLVPSLLSFYVQPGLRYYPDNGSPVQNVFKDRPWQFDLQLGIRLSLK